MSHNLEVFFFKFRLIKNIFVDDDVEYQIISLHLRSENAASIHPHEGHIFHFGTRSPYQNCTAKWTLSSKLYRFWLYS